MNQVTVKAFYDEDTATLSYVAYDAISRDAVVIDSVLDYDQASSKTSFKSLDILEMFLRSEQLRVHYILETHAHADHLTGAQELKKRFPNAIIAIGERITEVQEVFKKVFNLPEKFIPNGKQFEVLLKDKELLKAGTLNIEIRFTPGHTPACVSYLIGDALFCGDALFMPDTGTGRCDFPKGSSEALYKSIQEQIYTLPNNTRIFVGHDYKANNTRAAKWESTVGEEKEKNIQIKAKTTLSEYKEFRDQRDKNLAAPRLLLPSIQVNIDAGRIPDPESNGVSYLKIPIRSS